MKILIAASDLTPLIASDEAQPVEAVPSLPLALQRAGHEVSLVGPLWPSIEKSDLLKIKRTGVRITVSLGNRPADRRGPRGPLAPGIADVPFFAQEGTFGQSAGHADHGGGGTLFSKLVVELARRLNPAPDVLQIQDWPGALAPVFLRAQNLPFTSVLAVSDPAAQGSFPIEDFGLLNLGWEYFRPTQVEFYGNVNFLKAGILNADAVVAEGDLERFALQTPE